MEKGVLLIACFFILSACAVEKEVETSNVKNDPEMEVLVDNISDLAAKVLEIFEPIAAKTSNETIDDNDNTYFVSFLLRNKKNKTMKNTDGQPRQRMVVNNNFNGEKMGTSQVFVETGPPPKQPPMHNIQLLNHAINPPQGYQQPQPQPQSPQHQPQPYQQPYHHKQQQPVGLKYG